MGLLAAAPAHARHDQLSSWNDGPARKAIVEFVKATTDKSSPDYLPPDQRVATFDNDGTLWAEQPMVELLAYLRAHGYKTFIVSGGGIEFMRPWAEKVYGVPPEQVVGSSIKTKYELRDGKAVLVRLPVLDFIDDKEGKPVGINQHIGRRPVAAFGNSDGDQQMLEYTTVGSGGARLAMLVLHDDEAREFAYGPANGLPDSHVGTFSQALYDEARQRGWIVISMQKDWKRIYPPGH